jgi:hypothetical protein
MKTNLFRSVVGIVLLGVAAATNAASFNLTPTTTLEPTLNPGDVGLVPTTTLPPSLSSFTNDWFFTVGSAAPGGGAVTSVDVTVAPGVNFAITGLSAELIYTATSAVVASGPSFLLPSLAAGAYELVVTGIATGTAGGIYSGAVALTSVPLPAAAWLLLSGLAGVGAMARRRKSEKLALA